MIALLSLFPPLPPFTAVRSVGIVVVPPLPISPHLVQKRTDTIKPCTCKRVLITSTGVLPKTDAAPAVAPKSPVRSVGTFLFLSSPLYQSFMVSMTKKRIAWLLPCLMMVGVKPWYTPCRPAEIQKDCMRRMGNQSSYYGFHDEEAYSSLVFCPASRWWVSDPGTPLADLQKSKQTAREEGETSPLMTKQHTAWLRPWRCCACLPAWECCRAAAEHRLLEFKWLQLALYSYTMFSKFKHQMKMDADPIHAISELVGYIYIYIFINHATLFKHLFGSQVNMKNHMLSHCLICTWFIY